jgi:hypothetical protein
MVKKTISRYCLFKDQWGHAHCQLKASEGPQQHTDTAQSCLCVVGRVETKLFAIRFFVIVIDFREEKV